MLDDAQHLLAQNRAVTKANVEDAQGRPLELPEDDMGVHIGDVNNIAPAPVVAAASKVLPIVASALGAGGLGVAATLLGMYLARPAEAVKPADPPVAVAPVQPAAKAQEWRIKWAVEKDGKVTTWREAVPEGTP